MTFLEKLRIYLGAPSITAFAKSDTAIEAGKTLVQLFYTLLPLVAFDFFKGHPLPVTQTPRDPLWPLAWMQLVGGDVDTVTNIVRFGFLLFAVLGILFYRHRFARIAVFVGLWQAHALESFFAAGPNHQLYPWLYCSLILTLLPDSLWRPSPSTSARYRFLLIIWWTQAMSLLVYTMAGTWKIWGALWQIAHGEMSGFSPYALSYQVANWVPQLQHEAALAGFVINFPFLVWPAYLIIQYLQLTAIWAMVRPSLQKLYALELVLFHMGTYLIMGITFDTLIFLTIALFFRSPFMPAEFSPRQILHDLPGFGHLARLLGSKAASTPHTMTLRELFSFNRADR